MNLLFISADAHFVDPESEVSRRHRQYAQYFQTLGGKKIIIITRYDEGKKQIFWEDDFLKVLGFKKGPLLFFKMLFGAWRCGKQEKISLVSGQTPWSDQALSLVLSKIWQIPSLAQLHFDIFDQSWAKESMGNNIRKKISKSILKKSHKVRVVSHHLKNNLCSHWNLSHEKINVLVVPAQFSNKIQNTSLKNHKQLLFVGRLSTEKNLDFLFDVFKLAQAQDPLLKLHIVGMGKLKNHLENRARSEFLPGSIIFKGFLKGEELKQSYCSSSLLLLPSKHEGHGRVIVEAALNGLAVLASHCSGPKELVESGETGFLVDVESPEQMVEKILQLTSDQILAVKMGQKAKEMMTLKFSPQKCSQEWVDFLVRTSHGN